MKKNILADEDIYHFIKSNTNQKYYKTVLEDEDILTFYNKPNPTLNPPKKDLVKEQIKHQYQLIDQLYQRVIRLEESTTCE